MAIYDPIRVCNMALNRIGITQKIVDLNDTADHLAITCKDWYDISRDMVLAAFNWPFATLREPLGLVEAFTLTTDPDIEWAYAYRYPIKAIVVRRIVSGVHIEPAPIPFDIGQDATGRLIFTNQQNAIIEMTAMYTDGGEWPDAFASAVSSALAVEIAAPLRVAADKKASAKNDYMAAMQRAQGIANAERRVGPPVISRYITARNGMTRDPTNYRR